MSIQSLEITGLRAFGLTRKVTFAIPNGKPGSGLTLFVGPNNGGKSTIIEALRALAGRRPQSFSVGKRNPVAKDRIAITAIDTNGGLHELKTLGVGGSEASYSGTEAIGRIFVLPSRRFFSPMFGKSSTTRDAYITNYGLPAVRGSALDQFAYRLFAIQEDTVKRKQFDDVLAKLVQPLPDWTIDLADSGQYFLKFRTERSSHNSDGLGEGLVSCFFIVDALYDSADHDIIVIDEPELSLHPALQRRLAALLGEYASKLQIILATHSVYLIDFESVVAGAEIARVFLSGGNTEICALTRDSVKKIEPFLQNRNNPHILGLDAREVFFLDDGVILVEGQDDVAAYPNIAKQIGAKFAGHFFGWGVGGADNMTAVASMLRDLGFSKVTAILDGDKKEVAETFKREFPKFGCFLIDADDVRTKPPREETIEVRGLLDEHGKLRGEHIKCVTEIVAAANRELDTTAK
jgi:predicted ATPase